MSTVSKAELKSSRTRNELATVDCTDDIVVHDEDSCLSRMAMTTRRLPGRQQAVLIAVMNKTPSDSTVTGTSHATRYHAICGNGNTDFGNTTVAVTSLSMMLHSHCVVLNAGAVDNLLLVYN